MTAMATRTSKKAIGLDLQNNNCARVSRIFVHIFAAVERGIQRETS